jgi:hypothetical protein
MLVVRLVLAGCNSTNGHYQVISLPLLVFTIFGKYCQTLGPEKSGRLTEVSDKTEI